LSSDQIQLGLTLRSRKLPLFTLNGSGGDCQWFNFNAKGHERMLYAAGFSIEKVSKPYSVAFNKHPKPLRSPRVRAKEVGFRYLTGKPEVGVLHQAILGKPRV
jgi:hypothetical protein